MKKKFKLHLDSERAQKFSFLRANDLGSEDSCYTLKFLSYDINKLSIKKL